VERNNFALLPYLIPKDSDFHGSYRSNDGLILGFSTVLEECTASIYKVNELVQVDAEVIQRKKCVNYNRGWFEGIYLSQACKVQWGTELPQANGS